MPPAPLFPVWLTTLSWASIAVGVVCAGVIAIDETRRPQPMWIMNLVWPLCALFGGILWLAGYWAWGRGAPRSEASGHGQMHMGDTPMPIAVFKGASHCGAGCALGDLIAEWLAFAVPAVALAFGWRTVFADKMFAVWGLDYLVAFALGIAFQYFTLKPMNDLSVGRTIWQALKADFASITFWQVGMYGFMAIAQLLWLAPAYGGQAPVDTPEFWFVMQIAMLCGFLTAYPTNWLLVSFGVKEKM